MLWLKYIIMFAAAATGGAVNAVAGGGTLLTFPALLLAVNALTANATSTVALWPGALSSFWGYKGELGTDVREIVLLAVPSVTGGVVGVTLLLWLGNSVFAALVPYLILLATSLFIIQEPVARWIKRRSEGAPATGAASAAGTPTGRTIGQTRWAGVLAFQFLVGVYGGYFGAGIGILMLAAFGLLGYANIHHMNALKNLQAMCINGIAAAIFIVKSFVGTEKIVDWRLVALMAVASIVGGYAGAGTARRLGQRTVRRTIVLIGLALSAWLLVQQLWLGSVGGG